MDKKISDEHYAQMRKVFNEKIKVEKDQKKQQQMLEKYAEEEIEWLKQHPGCRRFFSSLNNEFNPMQWVFPDTKKIPCTTCAFRDKSLGGASKAFCQVYRYPNMKPNNVLWGENSSCEYKVNEKDVKKKEKTKKQKSKSCP